MPRLPQRSLLECSVLKWFRRQFEKKPADAPVAAAEADEFEVVAAPAPDLAADLEALINAPAAKSPVEQAEAELAAAPEPEIQSFTFDKSLFTGDASEEISAELQAFDATLGIEDFTPETAPAIFPREEEPAETPEQKKGFFARLRDRLARTRGALVDKILTAMRLHGKVDDELLEEIEEILLQSDVGVATTGRIIERLRIAAKTQSDITPEALLNQVREAVAEILNVNNRVIRFNQGRPTIVLVVGVNGTGKTTTIGKMGKLLADRGKSVMMVAADTFRAAAANQLEIWAQRVNGAIVRREEGADPAAVVFEALEGAKQETPDVILIDTAGRLHNKAHLMEELKKIVRVIQKHYPNAPHETVLVLDATTGQNALNQVRVFHEATKLTGLIMTKLDGTAKGGILIACKDEFKLPIFKIGVGEGVEDLRDFEPDEFIEALFGSEGDPASPETSSAHA